MVLLTREQLEDRLAVLHRASLELVGDLDLETVLERIVQMAREQAGARYAALGIVNEEGGQDKFIPVGMTQDEIDRIPHPPLGRGMLELIGKDRDTIRIPDINADPRSVGFPENHPDMRSFLGVPILLGERLLGRLYLTDKVDYYEFTNQDERVIEILAAYAAVAITNAHLYSDLIQRDEELSQRNEDLNLLNEVAVALTSSLDVDKILEQTLNLVIKSLGVDGGEIYLREDGTNTLYLSLHRGDFHESFFGVDHFRVGEGFAGMVAASGKALVSSTLRDGWRYLRPAMVEAGFQCMACVPLTAGGKVIGVMVTATRQKHCMERVINLMNAIGTWAGVTVENARLNRQARRLAVLEERERIGMDLHDGIIQSIYGVGLALDYIRVTMEDDPQAARQKIQQVVDSLDDTIRDIRAYILDLRPRQFHGEDLQQGLQRLVDEFQANCTAHATLVGPDNGLVDLPEMNATALFHICQEALANVAKHAQAKRTMIHLWITGERVLLEVSDDGNGFDLLKMSVTLGHGLSNMHVRARKVGGDVEITSSAGDGTTVLAWVPRRSG